MEKQMSEGRYSQKQFLGTFSSFPLPPTPPHPHAEWPPFLKPHCFSSHCIYSNGPRKSGRWILPINSWAPPCTFLRHILAALKQGRNVLSIGIIPSPLSTKASSSLYTPVTHSPSADPYVQNNNDTLTNHQRSLNRKDKIHSYSFWSYSHLPRVGLKKIVGLNESAEALRKSKQIARCVIYTSIVIS